MYAHNVRFSKISPVRIAGLLASVLAFLLAGAFSASAAPKSELWERWTTHDDTSDLTIDHSDWQRFLSRYVRTDGRGVNLVAYRHVSKPDLDLLKEYVGRMTLAPISTYTRKVQLAYWINLYNAITVRLIVENMPVESIRDIDISPGWFADGPWGKPLVEVEGVALSLDDIEHRILRPIWKDPRIHYAVNCASISCPNLRKQAFTGATADAMLTDAARDYVNNSRGVEFQDGELRISSIYKWFIEDFGGSTTGVLIHLRKYAEPALRARLGQVERIAGHRYDWSLNIDPSMLMPAGSPGQRTGPDSASLPENGNAAGPSVATVGAP